MGRSFAIIPAAGHSRRMGRAKLLMRWGTGTVLESVVRAWRGSRVDQVVVVARPGDVETRQLASSVGASVIVPETAPADMKSSVLAALEGISRRWKPTGEDTWLLAPADMPRLSSSTIDRVLEAAVALPERIVVPVHGGRRGHPISLPWSWAAEVGELGADQGINALVARHEVAELPLEDPSVLDDLDTPSDYDRLADAGGD